MTAPRDLIKAATPLPWHLDDDGTIYSDRAEVGYADVHDDALIVYAVNNLPALLDVAEALERLLDEFDYWTSEPRPAIDGGTVRLHKFGEVQPEMERKYEQARAALARLENQP